MRDTATVDQDALSTLDWWMLAGVDVLVDEAPRDWLAPVAPPAPPAEAPPPRPALPDTLAAFDDWWRGEASLPGLPHQRVSPGGDAASGVMLLIDAPDAEDAANGRLLSGKCERLFEGMLAAIGRDRASVYLASLSPVRSVRAAKPELADIARHHVALARPRRLLLLGKGPVEALLGMDVARARGKRHDVGGVPTVATYHPSTLADNALFKPQAWADLLLLMDDPA